MGKFFEAVLSGVLAGLAALIEGFGRLWDFFEKRTWARVLGLLILGAIVGDVLRSIITDHHPH